MRKGDKGTYEFYGVVEEVTIVRVNKASTVIRFSDGVEATVTSWKVGELSNA